VGGWKEAGKQKEFISMLMCVVSQIADNVTVDTPSVPCTAETVELSGSHSQEVIKLPVEYQSRLVDTMYGERCEI